MGTAAGADTPEGLTPRENSGTLPARGMYYAARPAGAFPISTRTARMPGSIICWQGMTPTARRRSGCPWLPNSTRWRTPCPKPEEFTVITYISKTNPYSRGASAFGAYGNYAVSAELFCGEGAEDDAREVLEDCPEHCHYVA